MGKQSDSSMNSMERELAMDRDGDGDSLGDSLFDASANSFDDYEMEEKTDFTMPLVKNRRRRSTKKNRRRRSTKKNRRRRSTKKKLKKTKKKLHKLKKKVKKKKV